MNQSSFLVTFYGVRGSLPSPMVGKDVREKLLKVLAQASPDDLKDEAAREAFVDQLPAHLNSCYGGNSSCVHLHVGGHHLIFDGGSGLRVLGNHLLEQEFGKGEGEAHLFLSHTHWDHIMGIPFFIPLYREGNRVNFYGSHPRLKERLIGQQNFDYFPVPFDVYLADIDVIQLENQKELILGDVRITWHEMNHPGQCFSYRVEYKGKSFIYATDSEYKNLGDSSLKPTIEFFRDADLLVFDSQYTFIEGIEKEDWGHSSTFIGVDIALEANVKKIAFYHHEPTYSDFKLVNVFEQTQKYLKAIGRESPLEMILSREGLILDMLKG
ncbi:MAG: MBL fold metallo-hydrolase [Nitrospinota bacterium]|nr:MBL fold metallo-hydrolase [Nitrospinota bacterium]